MDESSKIYIDVPTAAKISSITISGIQKRFKKSFYSDTRFVEAQRGGGAGGKQLLIALHCFTQNEQDTYFKSGIPQTSHAGQGQGGQLALPGVIETPENINTIPPPFQVTTDLSGQAAGEVAVVTALEKAQSNRAALLQFTDCITVVSRKRNAGLAEWQKEKGRYRADLLSLYQAAKQEGKKTNISASVAGAEFIKMYNTGIPYPVLFKQIGKVAEQTLFNWQSVLRKNNNDTDSLAPKHGMHVRGKSKVSDEELFYMVNCAISKNRPPLDEAIDNALWLMKLDGVEQRASIATYRRALLDWRELNYDEWVFNREGKKAWVDKVRPYVERDDSRLQVGDVLVADGHKFNFTCIDPDTGKPARPTVLLFFDWKSRMPAGWYIMFQENVQCIHAALRRAILRLGFIPENVLLDNGRAFRAKHFTSVEDFNQAGIVGLYMKLGIDVHFAKPYNAQSKVVERFFGTVARFERLIHTYVGTAIDQKPAHLRRDEKLHRRLYEKQHGGHIPTIEEIDMALAIWIDQIYGQAEHRGIGCLTPAALWAERKTGELDRDALRVLMMSSHKKKLGRNGVSHMGAHYWHQALYGQNYWVTIRYDVEEPDEVHVYSEDDSYFICTAQRREKAHPMASKSLNPADQELVRRLNKQQQELYKKSSSSMRKFTTAVCYDVRDGIVAAREPEQPMLTEAQAREIEEQANQIKVLQLASGAAEAEEPVMFDSEFDRYDYLLRSISEGETLSQENIAFMDEYRTSEEYEKQAWYFEPLKKQLKINQ